MREHIDLKQHTWNTATKAEGVSHMLVLLSLLQSNLSKTRNGSQMVENFSNELILKNQSLSIFPERKLGRLIALPWISLLGMIVFNVKDRCTALAKGTVDWEQPKMARSAGGSLQHLSNILVRSRTRKWEPVYLLSYCPCRTVVRQTARSCASMTWSNEASG